MNPARDPAPSTRGTTVRLEACVERLQAGDLRARDDLVALACGRMEAMARRYARPVLASEHRRQKNKSPRMLGDPIA